MLALLNSFKLIESKQSEEQRNGMKDIKNLRFGERIMLTSVRSLRNLIRQIRNSKFLDIIDCFSFINQKWNSKLYFCSIIGRYEKELNGMGFAILKDRL